LAFDLLTGHPAEGSSPAEARRLPPSALRRLVQEHYDFIWRLLARLNVSPPEVDDAAQQVFMVLVSREGLTIKVGSERAFLYGVALRVAKEFRRKKQSQLNHIVPDPEVLVDRSHDVEAVAERAGRGGRVGRAATPRAAKGRRVMKRLVDESTDELTRSLLTAGIEHHPPPSNQGRVLVALGAGSAFGLLSSNAFAWLGTTAGKVTAVSVVAVGVAGAVFSVAPTVEERMAAGSRVTAPLRAAAEETPSTPPASVDDLAKTEVAYSDANDSSEPTVATRNAEAVAEVEPDRASERRPAAKARKHERRATRLKKRSAPKAAAPAASAEVAEATTEGPSLDAEVRMVDDMHWAARRNDRAALERLVAAYRSSFPNGQLEAEVGEFAARLEREDTP
jgi:DNA-directed RNA polymerase specialized sigma24 family protein